MDSFISTAVFILPGFLMYFWIQAFGVNPVVKHSPVELTAISCLLWIPVSLSTIAFFNAISGLTKFEPIYNLEQLKNSSLDFGFLILFAALSALISFLFAVNWSLWGFRFQKWLINKIRDKRGLADLSDNSSVWDEVFLSKGSQVVGIGKIDKPEIPLLIGCIRKTSRTFEPERNMLLDDVDFFTELVNKFNVPVQSVFVDYKSGSVIKVFDPVAIKESQLLLFSSSSEED